MTGSFFLRYRRNPESGIPRDVLALLYRSSRQKYLKEDFFFGQQEEATDLHNIAMSVTVTLGERSRFRGTLIYQFIAPLPLYLISVQST
jgi:hypothetical protein